MFTQSGNNSENKKMNNPVILRRYRILKVIGFILAIPCLPFVFLAVCDHGGPVPGIVFTPFAALLSLGLFMLIASERNLIILRENGEGVWQARRWSTNFNVC